MLPALSTIGVIQVHVIQGLVTGEIFEDFIVDVVEFMNLYPTRNSVLVMDNTAIHRNEIIEELITERCVLDVLRLYEN